MQVCPICERHFLPHNIQAHVEECLLKQSIDRTDISEEFNSSNVRSNEVPQKRWRSEDMKIPPQTPTPTPTKKRNIPMKIVQSTKIKYELNQIDKVLDNEQQLKRKRSRYDLSSTKPMAERLRPTSLDNIVGQDDILGKEKPLRKLLESGHVPSMILWG